MIKAITTENTTKENFKTKESFKTMRAEVIIEGNGLEIMHEFLGILESMEKQCPEILIKAIQLHMEDK